jgi:hypothetical protein
MATEHNFLAAGRVLIANKATPIGTIGGGEDPAAKFLQVASVVADATFAVGILGHYFTFGHRPLVSTGAPLRANFKEAGDAVIFMFKQAGTTTYLHGITVEALIAWKPPARAGDMVTEDGLLQTWKCNHADLAELVPLQNTATHKLVDLADKMMSHLPSFAVHKVRNAKDAARWCKQGYSNNIKALVDKSEVEERARHKEARAPSARDRDAHQDVAKVWKERKESLLTCARACPPLPPSLTHPLHAHAGECHILCVHPVCACQVHPVILRRAVRRPLHLR